MDTDLIYGIDDRPPLKETLFAAIQHLLAIFVAIITPPLIIAGALKLDMETTGFLVSMALFASGVSTFVQCRKLGPVGAGLLCIQGTSFSFIGPIITAGLAGGLPLIFGVCIAASPVEMIVSRTFKYLRSVITPLVSGIVVLLIGLSLIKVGVVACGGGYTAMDNGTFGSLRNIGVAVCVLLSVLFFNRCKNKYLRMSSIVLGLCIGYAIAFAMGMVDMEAVSSQNLRGFNIPVPFKYGLDFNISSFVGDRIDLSDHGDRGYGGYYRQLDDIGKIDRGRRVSEASLRRGAGGWGELIYLRNFQLFPELYLRPE